MIKVDRCVQYIKIHESLNGVNCKNDDIIKDIVTSFDYDINEITIIVNQLRNKATEPHNEFGVILGRFQPFHLGHGAIVNEIILDNKKPILLVGSINKTDERNPLTFEERKSLINTVYSDKDIHITGVNDNQDNSLWMNNICYALNHYAEFKGITFYVHNKEVDRYDFKYKGVKYRNEFYTKMLEVEGFKIKQLEFISRTDIKIDVNARDIRKDIESNKHLLDGRIYNKLKELGW